MVARQARAELGEPSVALVMPPALVVDREGVVGGAGVGAPIRCQGVVQLPVAERWRARATTAGVAVACSNLVATAATATTATTAAAAGTAAATAAATATATAATTTAAPPASAALLPSPGAPQTFALAPLERAQVCDQANHADQPYRTAADARVRRLDEATACDVDRSTKLAAV